MHKYLILLATGPDPAHSKMFAQTGHFATPNQMMAVIVIVVVVVLAGLGRRAFGS